MGKEVIEIDFKGGPSILSNEYAEMVRKAAPGSTEGGSFGGIAGSAMKTAADIGDFKFGSAFKDMAQTAIEVAKAAYEAAKAVYQETDRMAKVAAQYNGGVAVAAAQANVSQIMGDIRRSNFLGPELADFTTQQSRVSQDAQDAEAELLKLLTPFVNQAMDWMASILEWLTKFLAWARENVTDGINELIESVEKILQQFVDANIHLRRIAKGEDDKKKKKDFVEQLLALKAPDFGPAADARRQPMGVRRGKEVLQRLGIPAFQGL